MTRKLPKHFKMQVYYHKVYKSLFLFRLYKEEQLLSQ